MSAAERLTRDRVIGAGIQVADTRGLGGLTMRSVADSISASPMALYQHVRNKDDLLDGMVDAIFAQIGLVDPSAAWRPEIRRRALAARSVLAQHPWAVAILDSRFPPGPATLRQHESVLALLVANGFALHDAALAYTMIDAFVFGFVVQDAAIPPAREIHAAETAARTPVTDVDHPHLVEFAARFAYSGDWTFADQFEPGLDLILNAIAGLKPRD